jgi:hypothetical protein
MESIIIVFPKSLKSDIHGIRFLCQTWGYLKKWKHKDVLFDMSNTSKIETNLLTVIGLIIKRVTADINGNSLVINLEDQNHNYTITEDYIKILSDRFNDLGNNPALQYHFFILDKEDENVNKYLNKDLLSLNLRFEKKIKKVLSELIANVKMHTFPKEAAVCGYYNKLNNEICISVCNIGMTIRQNIELKTKYEFNDDNEALEWAIKRRNTTRVEKDIGGLGLHFIRKYMKQSKGELSIISGKGMILDKRDTSRYSIINEETNYEKYLLGTFFPGTLVTIKFQLEEKDSDEIIHTIELIEIKKILEDLDGMFN